MATATLEITCIACVCEEPRVVECVTAGCPSHVCADCCTMAAPGEPICDRCADVLGGRCSVCDKWRPDRELWRSWDGVAVCEDIGGEGE